MPRYEMLDTAGGTIFASPSLADVEFVFEKYSVVGDYIWDNEDKVIVIANVVSILDDAPELTQ